MEIAASSTAVSLSLLCSNGSESELSFFSGGMYKLGQTFCPDTPTLHLSSVFLLL